MKVLFYFIETMLTVNTVILYFHYPYSNAE